MTEKNPTAEELEKDISSEQVETVEAEPVVEDAPTEDSIGETVEKTPEVEIEELKAQLKEEENRRFRVLADLENSRRRANLDKEASQKYRAQGVLTHLIPVLDNFQRGLLVEAESEDAKALLTGMEMVYRSLEEALKSEGLTEIDAAGTEFDPNFHQAVMTESDENFDSGAVIEVLQKGYTLKDRVLRPAMVKVNE